MPVLLALVAGSLTPQTAPVLVAQEIRGVAVSEADGQAISGALVELLTPRDERVDATLTAVGGGFVLRAPEVGAYVIRLRRIGFETWSSGDLRVEGVVILRLEIPISPIALAEIRVRTTRVCRSSPIEAERAWRLYEEAIASLEPIVWSETEGLYVYQVVVEESLPTHVRGRPVSQRFDRFPALRTEPPDTALLRAPIASLQPSDLARSGFVRGTEDGTLQLYPMTAATLLSREFLETHCLSVEPGANQLVGLRFEPVPGRDLPDVEGVFWMDSKTREPRSLEFEFTHMRAMLEEYQLPPILADLDRRLSQDPRVDGYVLQLGQIILDDAFGGRLEFDRLANDTWITRRWELRIPVLGQAGQLDWTRSPARVVGSPVAIAKTRTGLVTAVMAPASSTGAPARPPG